ncbi:MAG TPA: NosD domain-containing protein [Candidatus Acidoferrum sp.]|nr:NosD domain-containing protein [Candidatus Acidoferrum sp.]
MKKAVSVIFVTLLFTSMLLFSFNMRSVRGTTTIHVPDDYPTIQAAINAANDGDTVFVRTGTYYENVIINKTISLIGEYPSLTIINGSLGDVISVSADNVQIYDLHITFGLRGVHIDDATGTVIANNLIDYNNVGIELDYANGTDIANNLFDHNGDSAIYLYYSLGNTIVGNTISNTTGSYSSTPFRAQYSNGSLIYHNNFVYSSWDPLAIVQSFNKWDDGYPTGGNYWVNYNTTDLYNGPYQNITGSDGIGDLPFYIPWSGEIDHYPLIKPYQLGSHDVGVTFIGEIQYPTVIVFRTYIWTGSTLRFNTFIMNYGGSAESVNVTAYANGTIVDQRFNVALTGDNSTILTLQWNSTGFPLGSYNITVYASPILGETDITDNSRSVWMSIYIPGDINGDGKVDIKDISLVAKAFGQTVPPASPDLDVNQDWKIDIRDVAIVAKHFGEHTP